MTSDSLPNTAWRSSVLWLGVAMVAGLAVGIVSGALQQSGQSLWLLQPIGLGVALAMVFIGASAVRQRVAPLWSVVVAGLVAVAIQHVWLYRAELQARQQAVAKQAIVEMFKPGWSNEGFFSYFVEYGARPNGANWVGRDWPNFVLWGIDACLLVGATVTIVEWYRRRYGIYITSRQNAVATDVAG
jgi:hypothetical protein